MKRIILNTLLFLFPIIFIGQVHESIHLEWKGMSSQTTVKDIQINYLSFDGANNIPEYGSLPIYVKQVELPGAFFGCEIEIKINVADTLSGVESAKLSDAELLKTDVQYSIEYRENKAFINIIPVIVADDNSIILITDFNLDVFFVPVEEARTFRQVQQNYADHSVLQNGTWFKMGIMTEGIHKLLYNDLTTAGIDPAQLDLNKLGIFGNFKGMLPESNGTPRLDDLQENSIMVVGGQDGSFDPDDYILFYANAATEWWYNIFSHRFDHFNNLYADTVYYFLTPDMGTGKRINPVENTGYEPTQVLNTFYDFDAHDNDLENLIYSGKEWFGERLTGDTLERDFSFNFPNLRTDRPVYLNFDIVARGLVHTYYEVLVNGEIVIDSTKLNRIVTNSNTYARRSTRKITFFADQDKLDVKVRYLTEDNTAIAWLNFIEFNIERDLVYTGGQMSFRDPHISAAGNITRFEIEEVNTKVWVWDITDRFNPGTVAFEKSGNLLHFTLPTDTLKEFVVFDESELHSPVEILPINNQDLHSITDVNFVIISPDVFFDQAERLAGIHRTNDELKTVVVTPEQVYNEFSSGSQDVGAIRDFMRMLYKKGAFGNQPAYLLLFGDASYDYKHRVHENTNFLPTYESKESLTATGSFVTDDFFGLLDDDEGSNSSGELDIGIGRFPVTNADQAKIAVDKVEHYLSKDKSVHGSWRNNICFVADDEDRNLHLDQANLLISITDTLHPGININKIFSDAYTKVIIPGGKRFPEVNETIKGQVDKGTLILNYTGHGGLIGWAKEVILDVPTIRGFDNLDNMPLFITATCEFSRYDDPEFVSAGEYVFLNEKGAGIALLTTTRLAYAHANIVVNQRIYQNLLEREDGERPRLGDLVRISKIPANTNYLNFVLLGDPALRLAYPKYEVITEKINNKSTSSAIDTVHALTHVSVSGMIADDKGVKIENFNGYVYPKVLDKPSIYTTLGQEKKSYPVDFDLSDKILFDGKVSVVDGNFEFSFLVPKDISYKYGFGKISYYAVDTANSTDAWGGYEEIYIGGYNEEAEPDYEGPEILLYLNDNNFKSGDVTTSNPLFFAELFDEQGINATGNSLGRDINLVMDENHSNSMLMNEYFKLDVDSYKSGKIAYAFDGLRNGWHTINLKAWDLQNNSSEETIDFYVDDMAEILLSNVVNYPNPFTDETNFGFVHNKTGSNMNVEVRIYDTQGKLVEQLQENLDSEFNKISGLHWDGTDFNGNKLPAGLYPYHIIVTDFHGNRTVQRQKMIKLSH